MTKNMDIDIWRHKGKEFKVEQFDEGFTDSDGHYYPGIHYYVYLNDEYKVSIVKHYGSYGYNYDLWEIALKYVDINHLVPIEGYFDELCDDVIGYLSVLDVNIWITRFYDKFVEGEG